MIEKTERELKRLMSWLSEQANEMAFSETARNTYWSVYNHIKARLVDAARKKREKGK